MDQKELPKKIEHPRISTKTVLLLLAGVSGLAVIYLFQKVDMAALVFRISYPEFPYKFSFLVNRSIRFILNDLFSIMIIAALFQEKKYVLFALIVQLCSLIFILFPYLIVKWNFPMYNGPLINFLHRLVINPFLMILLIPAFWFQKNKLQSG